MLRRVLKALTRPRRIGYCGACGSTVCSDEPVSRWAGKVYHRECWRRRQPFQDSIERK